MPISMLFWPNWTRNYSNTLLQLFSVYGAIKRYTFGNEVVYFRTSNNDEKILQMFSP